jgi:hypothetical protein
MGSILVELIINRILPLILHILQYIPRLRQTIIRPLESKSRAFRLLRVCPLIYLRRIKHASNKKYKTNLSSPRRLYKATELKDTELSKQ